MVEVVMLVVVGYALGSIPFAFLIVKSIRGTDIRYVGSRNVGATNVMRTDGVFLGLIVMVLDIGKGFAAVSIAHLIGADDSIKAMVGVSAVVGHMLPLWLKFRGGKGVATAFGVFSILALQAMAVAVAIFMITVCMTRYISLGSILAWLSLPFLVYLGGAGQPVVFSAFGIAVLILYCHRENFKRLKEGRERRID
jgi:glycerol-3-phosphate acyltransferase PlsY